MILAASLMATEPKADELYRPYDTLKAIGFTKDEAKSFLAGIENAFDSKTIIAPKSDLGRAVKYRAQRSEQRYSHFKGPTGRGGIRLLNLALCRSDEVVLSKINLLPLATWLPIRLDYFGEAAFVFSFVMATAVAMLNRSLNLRPG